MTTLRPFRSPSPPFVQLLLFPDEEPERDEAERPSRRLVADNIARVSEQAADATKHLATEPPAELLPPTPAVLGNIGRITGEATQAVRRLATEEPAAQQQPSAVERIDN